MMDSVNVIVKKNLKLITYLVCALLYKWFKPLTPNDPYSGRTAPLTSKRCILYIYSTNMGTEYFKRGIYSPFFPLQNAVYFIILTYLVHVLSTFNIQGVLKLEKNNSGAKMLKSDKTNGQFTWKPVSRSLLLTVTSVSDTGRREKSEDTF